YRGSGDDDVADIAVGRKESDFWKREIGKRSGKIGGVENSAWKRRIERRIGAEISAGGQHGDVGEVAAGIVRKENRSRRWIVNSPGDGVGRVTELEAEERGATDGDGFHETGPQENVW